MEKLALTLVTPSRKLRPYFHAHLILVLTNYPLKNVLQKPDTSGLLKWAIQFSQFEINYRPRISLKGQALADFIVEFSYQVEVFDKAQIEEKPLTLFVDGSSNSKGSGAGIVLISPEGHKVHSALRFQFKASNNEAEYEALIAGANLAIEMNVENLDIYSDSQLVVWQVEGDYQAREDQISLYLTYLKETLTKFKRYSLPQVPRSENSQADALAKLALTKDAEFLVTIPLEVLDQPSVPKEAVMLV